MNMTAVAIVAIICWAIVELTNNGKSKKKSKIESKETDALREEVAELKDRVATLERIVTDEKYSLNKEFENLKKDDAA